MNVEMEWWRVTEDDNPFDLTSVMIKRVNGYMRSQHGKVRTPRCPNKSSRQERMEKTPRMRDEVRVVHGKLPYRYECPSCGYISRGSKTRTRASHAFSHHWAAKHKDEERKQCKIYKYRVMIA